MTVELKKGRWAWDWRTGAPFIRWSRWMPEATGRSTPPLPFLQVRMTDSPGASA